MSIYGIDHVQVSMPAGGEPLVRRFYGEVLGLEEIAKPPNLAARGGAWFRCGPLQLHLGVEKDFRPAQRAHPALLVSNLAEMIDKLKAGGFEIKYDTEPIANFDRAFTADPFGNRIELLQARAENR